MIARPDQTDPPDQFARTVLHMAAEVEAAEAVIKRAILEAAAAGDCDRVTQIVIRWQHMPATDVLSQKPLASMREIQVDQDVPPDTSGRE
jgi:hypothetical protein